MAEKMSRGRDGDVSVGFAMSVFAMVKTPLHNFGTSAVPVTIYSLCCAAQGALSHRTPENDQA
jgi:hypothetical protein